MPDTPDARAAQALELADVLDANPDTSGAHGDAAAALLRAMARDVEHLKEAYDAAADRQFYAQQNLTQEQIRSHSARDKLAVALKGLEAVHDLIEQSGGVYDLHRNGDPAPWSELRHGGQFEDWLRDFDTALDVVRDGDHFAGASKMVCEPYPGAFDGIIGTAEAIARNANCPGDPVPCPRCKGTGTVPRGPQICPTCGHGTTGTCAKTHGRLLL